MIRTSPSPPGVPHRSYGLQMPVGLRRLFPLASFVGCADIRVFDACEHSDECTPGVLFAAIRGTRTDGARYVSAAVERGAESLLIDRPLARVPVPQCVVPNVRKAYAQLCSALAGSPGEHLKMVGVTGTNGKTTVTWMIRGILRQARCKTGLLGTVEYDDGSDRQPSRLTTPDSKTFTRWLGRMVSRGTTHAAVELSSHALDQDRTAGTRLDAAVVTNVTHDHFDYHGDYPAYLACKARIVEHLKPDGVAFLNIDDAGCRRLAERLGRRREIHTYGLHPSADVRGEILQESLSGTRFRLLLRGEPQPIEAYTPLIGRHNVSNALAAAAACRHLGASEEAIAGGLAGLTCVPGRLEFIDAGQPFAVFVDYAHTDDALRRAVGCLRRLTRGRIICVFGAGGDRDRTKRPLLAQAAGGADVAIVTSDNPRTEDPQQIIADILAGFSEAACPHVEPNRAAAIERAVTEARPGDCVLIAGKGHECEQIIGTERLPFDDREVVRRSLRTRAAQPSPESLRHSA